MSGTEWLVYAAYAAAAGSAYATYEQGQAVKKENKTKAAIAKSRAKDQEIERRRHLVSLLATRNAVSGATGMAPTGSAQNLMRRDARVAGLDAEAARQNLKMNVGMLNAQGRSASRIGLIGAGSSLLGGYVQGGQLKKSLE